MEQYYLPHVQDLYIGYDYQLKDGEVWHRDTIHSGAELDSIQLRLQYTKQQTVRVPFLCRKDLEKDGWKHVIGDEKTDGDPFRRYSRLYLKNNCIVQLFTNSDRIYLFIRIREKEFKMLFAGRCPSMNEFRKICNSVNYDRYESEAPKGLYIPALV